MSLLTQDCAELREDGFARMWLCRLLKPTIGKKFLLIFSILAVTAVANWLAVEAMLSNMRGTTALVNAAGSLRWLSQRIQLDAARIVLGNEGRRAALFADLSRMNETIRSLEHGGSTGGMTLRGLPEALQADIAVIRRASGDFGRDAEALLAAPRADPARGLRRMQEQGNVILSTADAIASALTLESQRIEAGARQYLLQLGLLDLAILVAVLLVVRLRVVYPLRRLAAVSRGFARGQRGLRSGFRSLDEIGLLARAFDDMADEIERDLRQLAAGAEELGRREAVLRKFSSAVEHSPVPVMITDATGAIEYINPKFAETTGYAPEETLGRRPAILKSGRTPPRVYQELWQTLLSGREWHGEFLNRRKDGALYWEEASIAPVRDAAGHIAHFVAVLEDVTERKRAEEAIAGLNAELERRVAERTRQLSESNRELEAFSYSVSHDLRAPLRGINGFASLMAETCTGCDKSEPVEFLERIRKASVRMGSLIDDMLDLSRVARKSIVVEALDLSAMARSVLDDLAAAEPARRVETEVQDKLYADGDAILLRAALENLLGNAWKFTAQREPARIRFGCTEEGGERVFQVQDNGAGFDMKYADKLFGVFQRLHALQDYEGNGIGLAMVYRIVGLHGGRIWAEGAPGAGATFHFTLGERARRD